MFLTLTASDATKLQSDTTVCLILKQSIFSITLGSLLISSGLAHLDKDFFCFGERESLPCLSEKGYEKMKRSCKSPAIKGTYSRPLINDVIVRTRFSSSEYVCEPDSFRDGATEICSLTWLLPLTAA